MTALAEVQTALIPWPPPEGCPAWCEYVEGLHHPTEHPDDRWHYGPDHRVSLSLERPVEACDGTWEIDYLTVFLRQRQNQDVPSINLSQGEGVGVTLTLQEAADLAHALMTAIADTKEQADTPT